MDDQGLQIDIADVVLLGDLDAENTPETAPASTTAGKVQQATGIPLTAAGIAAAVRIPLPITLGRWLDLLINAQIDGIAVRAITLAASAPPANPGYGNLGASGMMVWNSYETDTTGVPGESGTQANNLFGAFGPSAASLVYTAAVPKDALWVPASDWTLRLLRHRFWQGTAYAGMNVALYLDYGTETQRALVTGTNGLTGDVVFPRAALQQGPIAQNITAAVYNSGGKNNMVWLDGMVAQIDTAVWVNYFSPLFTKYLPATLQTLAALEGGKT